MKCIVGNKITVALMLFLLSPLGCQTTQPSKPIQFIDDHNCWSKGPDVYDWKCEVDPNKKIYASLAKQQNVTFSYDEENQTTCWRYRVSEGEWEARCQEDKLETFKRAGCKIERFKSGLVAVSCP